MIILKLLSNGTYEILQGQHKLAIAQEMANASGSLYNLAHSGENVEEIMIQVEPEPECRSHRLWRL